MFHEKSCSISPCTQAFPSESDLVQQFIDSKSFQAATSRLVSGSIREFDCGNGIADIVYFSVAKDWELNRELAFVPPTWAYALRAIPYRERFNDEIFAKWCGTTVKTAHHVLSIFSELEFIRLASGENRNWIKVKQPKPITSSIWAFEAKLKDWKNALYQAVRYKVFAHQSCVLMDSQYVAPALRNVTLFARKNVSLASFDSGGNFTIHYTASKESPKSDLHFWQANAMIGAALLSN